MIDLHIFICIWFLLRNYLMIISKTETKAFSEIKMFHSCTHAHIQEINYMKINKIQHRKLKAALDIDELMDRIKMKLQNFICILFLQECHRRMRSQHKKNAKNKTKRTIEQKIERKL